MENYYLSVIVPVYNIEPYLSQCVDSILNNHCSDVEIILVDDGSKDGCGAICDKYAKNNENVQVIHKVNGGLVSARKAGAQAANGIYVTFVDGDDYVDNNLYASVIERLKNDSREDTEILIGSYKTDGIVCANDIEDKVYDNEEILNRIIPSILIGSSFKQKVSPAVWIKYFPREMFVNSMGIVNDVVRDGEDVLFSLSCLMKAGYVRVDSTICGYNYRILDNSMSHEYNGNYFDNASAMCKCMENIILEEERLDHFRESIEYTEAYMLYRYVDRELFCNIAKSIDERFGILRRIINSSAMGRSFLLLDTDKMNITRMMKFEIKLLQKFKIREVYMLRKAERMVHR